MPRYGRFRYGTLQKYGRYELVTTDGQAIGPHKPYRIRVHTQQWGPRLSLIRDRVTLDAETPPLRLRADDGPWVYQQAATIRGDAVKIRLRAHNADGYSPWLESTRGRIHQL